MRKQVSGLSKEALCVQLLAAIESCQTLVCLVSLLVSEKL